MADPGIGMLSYWQAGLEAVYGTAVAATRRFDGISFGIEMVIGEIPDESLTGQLSESVSAQGPIFYRFTIKQRLDYTGMLMPIDAVFGTATFGAAGGANSGANPYAHVFTEKTILNSHSLEFIEGNVPASKCTRLFGAKFDGFEFEIVAGPGGSGKGIITWTGTAKSMTTNFTPTAALTAPTPNYVIFSEITTMDDGTADIAADIICKSLKISMKNKAADNRFFMGSTSFAEQIRDGQLEVLWDITKEYKTKVLADAAIAYTSGSPKVVFGSTTSKRITFESGTAKIKSYGHPVNGPGIIEQAVQWKAFYNATDTGALKVTVEDTAATIT